MRTTLTIDNDLAQKLKDKAHLEHRSFKSVVNEAIQRGLDISDGSKPKRKFKVVPVQCGFRRGIDTGKLNRLVDDLAIEDDVSSADGIK